MKTTFNSARAFLTAVLGALLAVSCLTEPGPPPAPDNLEERNQALAEVRAQFAVLRDADSATALKALGHEDYRVRARAARRLGELGKDAGDAGPELIEALEDKKRDVRLEAAAALGAAKDKRALTPLIKALVDQEPKVRIWAWKSLKKMQRSAIPVLISHLKSTSPLRKKYFRDEAKKKQVLRNEIIRLMPSMGNAPVNPLIEALADKDKWLRRTSATVLGEIGAKAKPAVPNLLEFLASSEDNEQKVQICMALRKIGDHSQKVLDALEKQAKNKNKRLSKQAKKALKTLKAAAKKQEDEKKAKAKSRKKKP